MFSSSKNDKAAPPAPPPPMPNVPGARKTRLPSAPSIISADLVVTGTLRSTGDVQIDGRVEGDVMSASLVIGEKAFIHGDVTADDVTVRGRIEGSIRARKVQLASTCHVLGNILHEAFAVESGAHFEGNCRHADNPLAEVAEKLAQEAAAQPHAAPHVAPAPSAPPPRPAVNLGGPAATFTPLKS